MNANAKMDQLYAEAQNEINDEVYLRTQTLYCRKLEQLIRDLVFEVDTLKSKVPSSSPAPLVTPETFISVLNDPFLFRGKKIQIIKAVRMMFGYGLKEAKELVEKVTDAEELPF